MRRFTQQARSAVNSAIKRLNKNTNTDMTDYMIRGNSVEEETDPWNESPFTKTWELAGDPGEKKPEKALQNAKKIRDKTLRAGSISSDSAVEPAMDTLSGSHTPAAFYYRVCGPVAASADDVEWNTAFRVDLTEAPELHSEEWKEVVSEFNLSHRAEDNMVPKKIKSCYGALLKKTKRNDGKRAIHPEELDLHGPVIRDRDRRTAFEHIAKLPGVDGPDNSTPAWERSETAATAQETESHA